MYSGYIKILSNLKYILLIYLFVSITHTKGANFKVMKTLALLFIFN